MSSTKETSKPASPRVESYDIAKSNETLDLAKDLAKFIKENKLSTQVQGKEFVNVEGWQYAGSRLGIVPIVEHVLNVSNEQEIKYQAKVTLFDLRSQHTVGAGFAICSNKESGKKFYQEFAIASMAQTRAVGKAYRNILAWIIRAAGYEPTPAEEMEYTGNVPSMKEVPAAEPAGNGAGGSPAASEPPVTPAASSFAAPVASTGADEKAEQAPTVQQQINAITSKAELKKLFDELQPSEQAEHKWLFTLAKARIATAEASAKVRLATQQLPPEAGNMKEAGTDTALVAAVLPPEGEGEETVAMTTEQKQHIYRLLDHATITRTEKTKVLLGVNKLGYHGARRALATLRAAIDEREKSPLVTPAERLSNVRAQLAGLLQANEGKLEIADEARLRAALADSALSFDELEIELRWGREAAWDAESDGTERELAEAGKEVARA